MNFRRFFLSIIFILSIFLVGCKENNPVEINPFSEDLFVFAEGETEYTVTQNFTIKTKVADIELTYKSNNENVIKINNDKALVTRSNDDEFVTITISYVKDGLTHKTGILIIVLGLHEDLPDDDPDDEPVDDPDDNPDDNPGDEKEYTGYYISINGLTGNALKNELRSVISKNNNISDSNTRKTLEKSDVDPTKSNQLLLIYDRKNTKNVWDSGKTWDREHVWPKSLIPKEAEFDLHNLRASTPAVNNSRDTLPFKDSSGTYKKFSDGWYPGDEDKGDVARIVFYMSIRWNLEIKKNVIGELEMFIRWHNDDQVDQFEKNRNQVIYENQRNRNPFIDHPELVEKIFGPVQVYVYPTEREVINLNLVDNLVILNRRMI